MRKSILFLLLVGLFQPSLATAQQPPASVAVSFDRERQRVIVAEGLADRATGRRVTADDPVRIASVSKLVTALGVMRLVDKGVLSLDRDVSDYLGWPLRNPGQPDRPVTLRLLLSHQSDLTDAAGYAFPLGESLQARLADRQAWDAAHPSGSGWFAYANINFVVVASVMEAATGERFDRIMHREVIAPLGLSACFNWVNCGPGAAERAVVLYRSSGEVARDDRAEIRSPCRVLPAADGTCDLSGYRPGVNGALFSPQGGLRISMRDLARIGQVLAGGAPGFLTRQSLAEMVRPHWRLDRGNGVGEDGANDGFFCAYGLGVQMLGTATPGCRDALFAGSARRLGHGGEAYGLRSGLWFDPASGRGLAFFTTQVADDAPKGRSAFTAREEALVARACRGNRC